MSKQPSNSTTLAFTIALCVFSAFVLSLLASLLKPMQQDAQRLDRIKQMLMAAKVFSNEGTFLLKDGEGKWQRAKWNPAQKRLVKGTIQDKASSTDIFALFAKRVVPFLVDGKGNVVSFEEAKISIDTYLSESQKQGYAHLPLKIVYKVLPEDPKSPEDVDAYVIPVAGFGLWDAIYGFIALGPNGTDVIGISWYQHKETPGLGANIAEESWQKQFYSKKIFQLPPQGQIDLKTAPIGISVVRGKVSEVVGSGPKALSAVDGMAGATLTGNGVTKAYKETLEPYRPFFIKVAERALRVTR